MSRAYSNFLFGKYPNWIDWHFQMVNIRLVIQFGKLSMKRFHKYFMSLNERQRIDFAEAVGTTRSYIIKCFSIKREFSPEVCCAIERESASQVMRWDLRSDWKLIWPELKYHPQAPKD